MHIVAVTSLLIIYVLFRWRLRRLTVLPDTVPDIESARRSRKRLVTVGQSAGGSVGRMASLRNRLSFLDVQLLSRPDSFLILQLLFNIGTAVVVFLVTASYADKRTAVCAVVCYLVVTALPHSWSYCSFWGNLAGPVLLFSFATFDIAKDIGIPWLAGMAGAYLVFGTLSSDAPLAAVTVPLAVAARVLAWPTPYRYGLSMEPASLAGLFVGVVLAMALGLAARSPFRHVKRADLRTAHLATGPFLRLTLPFWALSVAGLFVLPPAVAWMAAAWLAGLAAGAVLSRAVLPKNLLALVPISAISAGAALDRLVFRSAAAPMDAYRVCALAVAAVWLLASVVSLWLHGWRLSAGQSLEVVAAPYARDATAARACGEYLDTSAPVDSSVINLTGLSSMFLYAPKTIAVGSTAWLSAETDASSIDMSDALARHSPDIVVTDETRCSMLESTEDTPLPYTFQRIFDGRVAVYSREDVVATAPAAGGGGEAELAVVVVAHNGAEVTERCLRSIARTVDVPHELILVDNASTDSTPELFARVEGARVVRLDDNGGYGTGANAGVAAAEGCGLVLLLHNDVLLTEGCVRRMIDTLDREGADAVGPQTDVARPPQRVHCGPFRHIIDLESFAAARARANPGRSLGTDALGGFCLLVRRDSFDAVGGFDDRSSGLLYSDADLCRRLVEHGPHLLVALDAFVMHRGGVGWFDRFRHGTDLDDLFRRSLSEFSARWQVVPELTAPDSLRAAHLRAQAHGLLETGRPVEALKLMMEAARVRPADATVYNDIGATLWAVDRPSEAFDNFRRAVELDPGLEDAAANLRDAANTLGRTDDVMRQLHVAQRVIGLGLAT